MLPHQFQSQRQNSRSVRQEFHQNNLSTGAIQESLRSKKPLRFCHNRISRWRIRHTHLKRYIIAYQIPKAMNAEIGIIKREKPIKRRTVLRTFA